MLPRQISSKNSLQLYLHYLESYAKKVIGDRGGRIEPKSFKEKTQCLFFTYET